VSRFTPEPCVPDPFHAHETMMLGNQPITLEPAKLDVILNCKRVLFTPWSRHGPRVAAGPIHHATTHLNRSLMSKT